MYFAASFFLVYFVLSEMYNKESNVHAIFRSINTLPSRKIYFEFSTKQKSLFQMFSD